MEFFKDFSFGVFSEVAAARLEQLRDSLSVEGRKHLDGAAHVTAESWLNAVPVAFTCILGDGDVVSSCRYM
jgi:hypothetical protein